jgi:hypothetical protein
MPGIELAGQRFGPAVWCKDIRGMMAAAAGVPLVRRIQLRVPYQSAGLG